MYLFTEVLSDDDDDDDDGTDMAMAVEIRGLVGIVALLLYCTSSSLGFAWRRRLSETVDRQARRRYILNLASSTEREIYCVVDALSSMSVLGNR